MTACHDLKRLSLVNNNYCGTGWSLHRLRDVYTGTTYRHRPSIAFDRILRIRQKRDSNIRIVWVVVLRSGGASVSITELTNVGPG